MSVFDTHAHYTSERFDGDREALLASMPSRGVSEIINVECGGDPRQYDLSLSERYPFVYSACGVHPHEAGEAAPGYLDHLVTALKHPKTVALGEIGLDYHYDFSPRDVQRRVFREQMALAQELGIPVAIHSREATADTLAAVRDFPGIRGVVHCFSGSAETAKVYLSLGYFISFTGVVTFPNIRSLADAVRAVPLERMFLETDCPYLAPVPFRGKRCDSSMIPHTAAAIAQLKGSDADTVIEVARANALRFFGIAPAGD